MNQISKVLIVQTAFIGDVILITPLIKAVYEYFRHPVIDVMVIPQSRDVLQNNPFIRKVILFDKRTNKAAAFASTLFRLRAEHYDVAFTPHSSFTTALLLLLAGIPRRVGYDRWTARYLLTDRIPDVSGELKLLKNLSLMKAFTTEKFVSQTELFPSQDDYALTVKNLNYSPGTKVIALAPGSVWFTKRWLTEHYVTLTKLLSDAGFKLVFIGSKAEKPLCDDIIRTAGISALNTAGELTLLQSAALISRCDLLICNDSGALHIGNAMQTTVFAIFGPTVQAIGYYPYRENDRVFEVEMSCRPCGTHGHNECPQGHHNCMRNVSPGVIFQVIVQHFDKLSAEK